MSDKSPTKRASPRRPRTTYDFRVVAPQTQAEEFALLGAGPRWVELSGKSLPFPVRLRVEQAPSGRLVCTGLLIGLDGPHAITARTLRQIQVGDVLTFLETGYPGEHPLTKLPAQIMRQLTKEAGGELSGRSGRAGRSREFFRELARRYRQAERESPRSPVKLLRDRWYSPYSEITLRRWLSRCRADGLLPPGRPGRAANPKGGDE